MVCLNHLVTAILYFTMAIIQYAGLCLVEVPLCMGFYSDRETRSLNQMEFPNVKIGIGDFFVFLRQ